MGEEYIAIVFKDVTIEVYDIKNLKCIFSIGKQVASIETATYSPNGQHIAIGSGDGTAKIWDTDTFNCTGTLNEPPYSTIFSIIYSMNGKRIITTHYDGSARVWNAETLDCIGILHGHTDIVFSVSYSPNGQQILTISDDGTAKIWNANTFKCEKELIGVDWAIYSPDGKYIASIYYKENFARLWDTSNFSPLSPFGVHTHYIISIAFSPNGRYFATASCDGNIIITNMETLLETSIPNKHLTLTSNNKNIMIWNSNTLSSVILTEHTDAVISIAFSPDEKYIITSSDDETIKIWDTNTFNCIETIYNSTQNFPTRPIMRSVIKAEFSPNGKYIFSTTLDDGLAKIYNAKNLYENETIYANLTNNLHSIRSFNIDYSYHEKFTSTIFSPNSQNIMITTKGISRRYNEAFVWNIEKHKIITEII